jgi:hypothetical protein
MRSTMEKARLESFIIDSCKNYDEINITQVIN